MDYGMMGSHGQNGIIIIQQESSKEESVSLGGGAELHTTCAPRCAVTIVWQSAKQEAGRGR